jgi:hypothetical protein
MNRARLLPLLWLLFLLFLLAAPAGPLPALADSPPRPLTLAGHLAALRVFAEPPAQSCPSPAFSRPSAPCIREEPPAPPLGPLPGLLDTSALAMKLAPPELKRCGIDLEVSELLPLGYQGLHQGLQGRKPCGSADHFVFLQHLGRGCLMDDRPDTQGFEFGLGCPVEKNTRLTLELQAEEGGRLGRSDLRTLLGFSFNF